MTLNELVRPLVNEPTANIVGEAWDRAQVHFTDRLANRQTKEVRAIIDKYGAYVQGCPSWSARTIRTSPRTRPPGVR
jgi:hypothetical protein